MGDTRPDDLGTTQLALAARDGDRVALEEFVRATQRDVYRFLVHLAGVEDAEDLAQETYARAVQALPRFAGRSSARAWLLAIARRVAVDRIRRAMVRPRTMAVADWEAVEPAPAASRRNSFDEGVLLADLIAGLEPDRREAFVLTQVLDLSYATAAEVCGCPVGTIRSRVARAREDLVRALDDSDTPGQQAAGQAP